MAGLRWSWLGHADGFAVDGAHDALPACQGFLKRELNVCDQVVADPLEVWMFFLWGG